MNYIEAANSTNTDVFHEGMKMGTVIELLHQLIDIGTTLDAVKKYQFYGRKTEETQDIERYQNHMAISYNQDAEVNPWIEEVNFAALLPGRERTDAIRLYHAIIGGITESVEMAQALLTAIQDGKPLDEVNLLEETGDGMWYTAALLRVLGKTFEDAQRANVAKLNKRYPNGSFDAFLAQQENRDLDAERKVLEGGAGNELPERVQRMLAEYGELGDKARKLAVFINGDMFKTISANEQQLMYDQHHGMCVYMKALDSRIEIAIANEG